MVFVLNDEQLKLCKRYVMQVYEADKSKLKICDLSNKIIVDENVINDFMDAADYAIIHFGMVNQDYLTPLGCKLQFLYDELLYQKKQQLKK